MDEEIDDYDDTLKWAIEEEKLRATRGQGVGSFYLVIASILIVLICALIFYYANKGRKDDPSALEMMQDEDNIFDDEFSNVDEYEEVIEDVIEDVIVPPIPVES